MRRGEPPLDLMRLGQGQRTAARADPQRRPA